MIAQQNDAGQWTPAIPLPLHLAFGRKRCSCGVTRWGLRRYREHYALAHIIDGEPAHQRTASADTVWKPGGVIRAGTLAPGSYGIETAVNPPYPADDQGSDAITAVKAAGKTLHYDAGGDDGIACGAATGFSTRNAVEVNCQDCAPILYWLSRMNTTRVGQVIPWPLNAPIPQGWLRCDSAELVPEDWPDLYAEIGYRYGHGYRRTGHFLLPGLDGGAIIRAVPVSTGPDDAAH